MMRFKYIRFTLFCVLQIDNKFCHSFKLYLRSSNTGYARLSNTEKYLKEKDTLHRKTVARNPEQNGVSERANRFLVEMSRCLLMQSWLPDNLWEKL